MLSQTQTEIRSYEELAGECQQKIIAIGGGKGGIGKSLLAANMGVHLALSGRRAVLVDADLGGANLHTCLGVPPPDYSFRFY